MLSPYRHYQYTLGLDKGGGVPMYMLMFHDLRCDVIGLRTLARAHPRAVRK